MRLNVPYYSQYLDVPDLYWAPRACGFCCMKMIAEYHGIKVPDIVILAKEAKEKGGYGESGLKHEYVVEFFKQNGLDSYRGGKMEEGGGIEEMKRHLSTENPVIISVAKKTLGQNKFHQVVLTGFELGRLTSKLPSPHLDVSRPSGGREVVKAGFYFHDPESLYRGKGEHIFVSLSDFLSDWRRIAIFVSKK